MFSGLTSQVSNWMGKKNEDGTEVPSGEDKISPHPPGTEGGGDFEGDKKDAR